jgi:hypothetical protein
MATEPGLEQTLALLGAFATVGLSLAEELGELGVVCPLGVIDVPLQTQRRDHGVGHGGVGRVVHEHPPEVTCGLGWRMS